MNIPTSAISHRHPLSADYDVHRARLQSRAAESPESLPQDQLAAGFNEVPSNQDFSQTDFQAALLKDLGPQVRMQNQQDVSKVAGRLPSVEELQQEFQKLAQDKDIPFEYIKDGCYARAHLMCETMQEDNINCAKMFVMLESPMGAGKLTAENKYMKARWWYHVAPLSFAENPKTHKVEAYIMDPSMSNRPLTPQEWIHDMWDEKTRIKIDVTRDPQYGPVEVSQPNKTFEESLADARQTAAEYTKELEKIKEDYNASHPGGFIAQAA